MGKRNVSSTDFQVVAFVVASQESFGVCVGGWVGDLEEAN